MERHRIGSICALCIREDDRTNRKEDRVMSEMELRAQLDAVKAQRRDTERFTDDWAALCVEMGRLTAEIWKIRRERND